MRLEKKKRIYLKTIKETEYLLKNVSNNLLAAKTDRGAGEVLVWEKGVQGHLVI